MSIKKYIKNTSQQVHLSSQEKEEMRSTLREYMALKPARTQQHTQVSQHSGTLITNFLGARALPALLIVALVFGSGAATVFASQSALPGDKLYKIKLAAEQLEEKTALTTNRRARVATKIAERRLAEVYMLRARGTLSKERETQLQQEVQRYSDKAKTRLQILEAKNPQRAARMRKRLDAILQKKKNMLPAQQKKILKTIRNTVHMQRVEEVSEQKKPPLIRHIKNTSQQERHKQQIKKTQQNKPEDSPKPVEKQADSNKKIKKRIQEVRAHIKHSDTLNRDTKKLRSRVKKKLREQR